MNYMSRTGGIRRLNYSIIIFLLLLSFVTLEINYGFHKTTNSNDGYNSYVVVYDEALMNNSFLIVGGRDFNGSYCGVFTKVSFEGDIVWSRFLCSVGSRVNIRNYVLTRNGSLIFFGFFPDHVQINDTFFYALFAFKTSLNVLNVTWWKTYFRPTRTSEGSTVVVSQFWNPGNKHAFDDLEDSVIISFVSTEWDEPRYDITMILRLNVSDGHLISSKEISGVDFIPNGIVPYLHRENISACFFIYGLMITRYEDPGEYPYYSDSKAVMMRILVSNDSLILDSAFKIYNFLVGDSKLTIGSVISGAPNKYGDDHMMLAVTSSYTPGFRDCYHYHYIFLKKPFEVELEDRSISVCFAFHRVSPTSLTLASKGDSFSSFLVGNTWYYSFIVYVTSYKWKVYQGDVRTRRTNAKPISVIDLGNENVTLINDIYYGNMYDPQFERFLYVTRDDLLTLNSYDSNEYKWSSCGLDEDFLVKSKEDYDWKVESLNLTEWKISLTDITNSTTTVSFHQGVNFSMFNNPTMKLEDACTYCNDVDSMDESVCSSHGVCAQFDFCNCTDDYSGEYCDVLPCFGVPSTSSAVCGGHGSCVSEDVCDCDAGYLSSTTSSPCDYWYCFDILHSSEKVCSGHGKCSTPDHCVCTGGFEEKDCSEFSCGEKSYSKDSCTGYGKCLEPGVCDCVAGRGGSLCENNLLLGSVMAPVLSVSGVAGLIILSVFLCCVILCCYALVCCCVFLSLMGVLIWGQSRKVSRFSKLKNFDLLMKEQELEEDSSVAHLRIKSELYQIDFSEIKIDTIIGEGGSDSVVMKAYWSGRIVAFKCFKTRLLCSKQENYNQFEREVEILASISHPNIVRFFGATMNPPRVGIIIEFCENGDLDVFLADFKKKFEMTYPLQEKVRMLKEITNAFVYLHGRNIIHRDLKLENVLVDSQMQCKLMDFGLSKIVDQLGSSNKTKNLGTNLFMAPELVISGEEGYDQKVDVFAFGILCWIVIVEEREPYGSRGGIGIEMRVAGDPSLRPNMKELQGVLDGTGFDFLLDIVQTSWDHESSKRMEFEDILKVFEGKGKELLSPSIVKEGKRLGRPASIMVAGSSSELLVEELKKRLASVEEMLESEQCEKQEIQKRLEEKEEMLEEKERENESLEGIIRMKDRLDRVNSLKNEMKDL